MKGWGGAGLAEGTEGFLWLKCTRGGASYLAARQRMDGGEGVGNGEAGCRGEKGCPGWAKAMRMEKWADSVTTWG